MSEVSVWFCRPGCDCQRCNALREVPRLAAENARLRVEVEADTLEIVKLRAELVDAAELRLADEQSVRNMERRMTEWQRAAQSQERLAASLTADLARVTAERDAAASSLMAIAQLKQIEDEVKREKFWKTKKPRARCGTGGER